MSLERVASRGVSSAGVSHEAELVAIRVCNRELSRPIRRVEEGLYHCDPVLQLDPQPVRVGNGEVEPRTPPSASMTAKVAPPAD